MFSGKGHRFRWRNPLDAAAALADRSGTLLLYSSPEFRSRAPRSLLAFSPKQNFTRLEEAEEQGRRALVAGLIGYEYGQRLEDIPPASAEPVPEPVHLAAYRKGFVFHSDTAEIRAFGQTKADAFELLKYRPKKPDPTGPQPDITPECSRSDYEAAIARAVAYIHAGDIFQVNLSQSFSATLRDGDTPFALYRRLVEASPSPYSMYHRISGSHAVISNSPERFLKVDAGRRVTARPIKGTRARGATPEADRRLADELLTSEKDRAENLMIVDLMRNDLSRFCKPGTVKVPELFKLESYANVHHLVSTVTGELLPGQSAYDVLRATFPPGSITGAPKVRAMEIISELELSHRGPYCGAVGYVSPDGAADFNVMIRTVDLHLTHGRWQATFRSGGGIVADSDPAAEYEETLSKAASIAAAIKEPGA